MTRSVVPLIVSAAPAQQQDYWVPSAIPGSERAVVRHFLRIRDRVDRHMQDGRLAAGIRALDGRADVLRPLDILTVATEAFGDFVEPHVLAPVHAGFS